MAKLKFLFVCIENAGRSQMAEGFAKKYGAGKVEAYSAGSKPSGHLNSVAVKAMEEAGIDISKNISKGFGDLPIKQYDYVITMGCGDACPYLPAREHIDWETEDPKGKPIEVVRKIRDEIEAKVKELVATIPTLP